ncbi:MAG TPA: hypothetical protein VK169_10605 [Saprospiraceae bacterium]|nr:hypothetical protein [Saprospiraceae bacterium]
MKQQLRKPENWQDFEELCRMLWGEIWNSPETKKNGRNGQDQQGVDVSGTPSWEIAEYYGIQCKGKDDYTHAQLSEKEIDRELEKAKNFKPKLKKFYFATTANKDSTIEEYIRLKDVESRKAGYFEVHLFSWEEIVTLIDQNKRTYDWYVRKINFKTLFDVTVLFHNGQTEIEFSPILVRNRVKYRLRQLDKSFNAMRYYSPKDNRKKRLEILYESQPTRYYINGVSHNKSSCVFSLTINNTGDSVLENYKLYFDFLKCPIIVDTVDKQQQFLDTFKYKYDTFISSDTLQGVFEPPNKILVQKDSISTDDICIRPTSDTPQLVKLEWRLVAKNFNTSGQLTINLNTRIKEKTEIEEYEYPLEDEVRLENYTGHDE